MSYCIKKDDKFRVGGGKGNGNNGWFWWMLTAIVVVSVVIFLLGRKTRPHVGVRQSGTVMVSVPEAPAKGQTGMVTFTIRPRLGQENRK